MKKENKKEFVELRDVWGNHALSITRRSFKKRFIKGLFNIGVMRKINPKKAVAVIAVIINTPLPTASPVTNPIIYRKIMKFNSDKLGRKINCIKMRIM